MKKQHFISALALVLLSVFFFSCVQDNTRPTAAETAAKTPVETAAETAAVQNKEALDTSKSFPLPAEIQQLSEEDAIKYIQNLTDEDLKKMAAEYAAQNHVTKRGVASPVSSMSARDCLLCAQNGQGGRVVAAGPFFVVVRFPPECLNRPYNCFPYRYEAIPK